MIAEAASIDKNKNQSKTVSLNKKSNTKFAFKIVHDDIEKSISIDPYLEPFKPIILSR